MCLFSPSSPHPRLCLCVNYHPLWPSPCSSNHPYVLLSRPQPKNSSAATGPFCRSLRTPRSFPCYQERPELALVHHQANTFGFRLPPSWVAGASLFQDGFYKAPQLLPLDLRRLCFLPSGSPPRLAHPPS